MVQSLELILDDALDESVRREGQMLLDADLPSQGRHPGSSNRPHITLSVAEEFDRLDARLESETIESAFPVRLGALIVFRGRSVTLARSVVVSESLLELHSRVSELAQDAHGYRSHTRPGRWTPHVTIARRLTHTELFDAIRCLDSTPVDLDGTTSGLRRWDGERKIEWLVGEGRHQNR